MVYHQIDQTIYNGDLRKINLSKSQLDVTTSEMVSFSYVYHLFFLQRFSLFISVLQFTQYVANEGHFCPDIFCFLQELDEVGLHRDGVSHLNIDHYGRRNT